MKKFVTLSAIGSCALFLAACDVEQTQEGELPEIEGGQLPEYDVDTADVEVTTEERTVEVPVVNVEEADASKPEAAE